MIQALSISQSFLKPLGQRNWLDTLLKLIVRMIQEIEELRDLQEEGFRQVYNSQSLMFKGDLVEVVQGDPQGSLKLQDRAFNQVFLNIFT